MDFGSLRALALDLNFSAHGVDAVVTRPAPDDEPVETRGIWITPLTEDAPVNAAFARREPRRILALKRSEVPTVPRGTGIQAPEKAGDDPVGWRVDGMDRIEADHQRVIVVRDTLFDPDPEAS